jgi:hypothetical protein
MGIYRESGAPSVGSELKCPRCAKQLPALDVASCSIGCGTWVSAFAATEVLSEDERRANRVTQWWKVRAPCPMCSAKMILRGMTEYHFQGCDGHGFWIDADEVPHTGLANGIDLVRIEQKREDGERVQAEREATRQAELERAEQRDAKQARESALRRELLKSPFEIRRQRMATAPTSDAARVGAPHDPHGAHAMQDWVRTLEARIDRLEARNAQLENRIKQLEGNRASEACTSDAETRLVELNKRHR